MASATDVLSIRARLSRRSFTFDVAFEVPPGEILALVGPSGAGKSTCISAIAGLLPLERGRVCLGEEVWCDTEEGIDWPPHRRRVGFVHQEFALFPHLTVLENVMYGSRARRRNRDVAFREGTEWTERLGISALAQEPVGALSGGQRQRTALARSLAAGARVLLLDEPFGSLDTSTRSAVRGELCKFLREVQLPTVLVTHDPMDAVTSADRIAILEEGRVSQIGTCDELLVRPRTPFVAQVFDLNFYRAELGVGRGLREARVGGVAFHVLGEAHVGPVALAFPPSAVTLSVEKPAGSAQNTFQGVVREIVPLLERIRVVLDCGVPMAAEITREAAQSLGLSSGRTMWASVKATAIHVYP